MFDEDELFPISALQHFVFCPRRCALVHIEQIWTENQFTVEGDILHERVDELGRESRTSLIVSHGVGIRSLRFGVTGKVDVVEFRLKNGLSELQGGCTLEGKSGTWTPYPIEYKRGTARRGFGDDIQICAQALCLEEMLGCPVPAGSIYYASTRKRREIAFDVPLRAATTTAILGVRALLTAGLTPPAEYGKKCDTCSLFDRCQPKISEAGKDPRRYVARYLEGM
jgi:CRISPR-associated exonuclease Cas4